MFDQNLGNWYITLDDIAIDNGNVIGMVGFVTAQNSYLNKQMPTYGVGSGWDSDSFVIDRSTLKFRSIPDHATKSSYIVNITSTGGFGTGNFRVFEITVTGASDPSTTTDGIILKSVPITVLADTASPDTPQNLSVSSIQSPLQQVWNGVPIGEVECSNSHVLMTSPSGLPACVFTGSVDVLKQRGFVLSSDAPRDDLSTD